MIGNHGLHPTHDELTAYGLGKLHPPESVAIETHIADCEECCETLHDLGNDTFVDLVRESNALQFDSVDAGMIGLGEAGNETVSDLPSELTNHPRYRVVELLGKGGMGNVYKAQHSLMNRTVAVKVIDRQIVKNTQAVERFQREVQSAAQLAHANIVTAYDAEQAGDLHLLVMEYVPGDNLADVVKREGPLKVEHACNYIRQAALGLQHAHDSGMVHRDIKPHNLMVTGDEQLKVLDFGLATLADRSLSSDAGELKKSDAASNLTSAGSIMGTPDFISPEQATDASAADIRSDIYSLGCTFFYLLTGRPPFSKGTALDRIKAHSEQEVESIESIRDDVPPELAEVLRRMMAKKPSERFQSPAAVADALAPFVDAHRTTPASGRAPENATMGHRSWWAPTILQSAALAGFAFVLAGIIYVTTNNGTLEIDSADDSVEVVIRSTKSSKQGQQSLAEMRIVDTLTGSSVKRLPSGEYVLSLKGDKNSYVIDRDRFVLRRGEEVIVRVTPKPLDEKSTSAKQTIRTVWANAIDVSGKVSPDGRYVAFVDRKTRNLSIRNLVDGTDRQLTDRKAGERGSANTPVFSPDSQQIAFAWTTGDLRIIDIDGKNQRTLYRNKEAPAIFPYDWSPDGSEILAHIGEWDNTRRIVRVSVVDGTSRPVKTLGWNYLNSMMYSPDGRYIAYAATPSQQARHNDIYVVATNGGEATPLVQEPSNDVLLGWAPEGRRILFVSDRAGQKDAWLIGFRNGKPEGRPMLAKSNIGDVWPMGMTSSGALYFGADHAAKDIFTADFDPKTGMVAGPLKNISTRNVGANLFPGWSPSGDRIAFASERNRPGQARAISVVSLDSGEEKTLSAPFGYFFGAPRWSPDERLLRVHGVEFTNRKIEALYSVNVETEESERLTEQWVKTGAGCSPDGTIAYSISGLQDDGTIKVFKVDLVADKRTEFDRVLMQTPRPSFQLAVSPDGQKVAYTKYLEEEGAWHIVLRDVDGGNEAAIYKIRHGQDGSAQQLNWTADGSSLLYGEGVSDFVLIPVDGGSPVPIQLNVEDKVHAVALHPSGKQIAINVWQKPKRDVWVLENFLPPEKAPDAQSTKQLETVRQVRRVWDPEQGAGDATTGGVSLDGRYVSMLNWKTGDLGIQTLATGQERYLTKGSGNPKDGYAYYSKPSPDGKQIAYTWSLGTESNSQLRVFDLESGEDQLLYHNPDGATVYPRAWSPDGRSVVALVGADAAQIVEFSVKQRTSHVIKTLLWGWPETTDISPDGDFLVYDLRIREESQDRDIFILPRDGHGDEVQLVHQAIDSHPLWTPDGRGIVFNSNRGGNASLWYQQITKGQPVGEPALLVENMSARRHDGRPLGFDSDGSYYFARASDNRHIGNIYSVELDAESNRVTSEPKRVIQRDEGRNTLPGWSQDGRFLSFTTHEHGGANRVSMKIRDVLTGNDSLLLQTSALDGEFRWWVSPRDYSPAWSPDNETILVVNSKGLHSIEVPSGRVSPLITDQVIGRFIWSKDGTEVCYVRMKFDGPRWEWQPTATEIVARHLDTGSERVLYEHRVVVDDYGMATGVHSLARSPDGEELAFATIESISTIPVGGGTPRQLLQLADDDRISKKAGIVWAARGNSVLFVKNRKSSESDGSVARSELWKVAVNDGASSFLGLSLDNIHQLCLQDDGGQVSYCHKPPAPEDGIWVIENFLPTSSTTK